ncbi:XRE family transcriptional regulator [Mycobacterium kansasii]|nr:XRE family transcriptional regulator [Mycobacterium kansasii]
MATMGTATAGQVERLAGNLLRIARARVGMSQRELAEAANVPQSTVARIESGARQPSLPVLARILAAVDLELRINLDTYDPHDDVLELHNARLDPAERAARQHVQDALTSKLRPIPMP